MNKLEKILSKWNFKKIAVAYIIGAVIALIGCGAAIGIVFHDRISFAYQYTRLEESIGHGHEQHLHTAMVKTAAVSEDVVDILALDQNNNVVDSAKNSAFAKDKLELTQKGAGKKYLFAEAHPNAVFKYVKNDEFMLNSIINTDFGEIRHEYDDDSFYRPEDSAKDIYMLSCIRDHDSSVKVYVISKPTTVPGGMAVLSVTAAAAVFFFMIYWVLIALWLYRDAARSKLSPLLWGLIGLFTNIIGVIVYEIYKKGCALCPNCGGAQNINHLFCSYCGRPLGKRCASCGGKVGAKDSFCHHCGHDLTEEEREEPETKPETEHMQ